MILLQPSERKVSVVLFNESAQWLVIKKGSTKYLRLSTLYASFFKSIHLPFVSYWKRSYHICLSPKKGLKLSTRPRYVLGGGRPSCASLPPPHRESCNDKSYAICRITFWPVAFLSRIPGLGKDRRQRQGPRTSDNRERLVTSNERGFNPLRLLSKWWWEAPLQTAFFSLYGIVDQLSSHKNGSNESFSKKEVGTITKSDSLPFEKVQNQNFFESVIEF